MIVLFYMLLRRLTSCRPQDLFRGRPLAHGVRNRAGSASCLGLMNTSSHREQSTAPEDAHVPVSALEARPTFGGCMSQLLRRTWSLVVNALRVYHVYGFLRDRFDDFP